MSIIEALLARVPKRPADADPMESHAPPKPTNPHAIILEGSICNPRAELEDDPLQVSLGNFYKISTDEYAERLLRQEILEQKLGSLKLSHDGSRLSEVECVATARFVHVHFSNSFLSSTQAEEPEGQSLRKALRDRRTYLLSAS